VGLGCLGLSTCVKGIQGGRVRLRKCEDIRLAEGTSGRRVWKSLYESLNLWRPRGGKTRPMKGKEKRTT